MEAGDKKRMKIVIQKQTTIATGNFGRASAQLAIGLEGRKVWKSVTRLHLETSGKNLSLLKSLFPAAVVEDERLPMDKAGLFDLQESSPCVAVRPLFRMPPRDFQSRNFELFKDKPHWAIFSEQGTGKTKVAIDIISHRWLKGTVTGVVVLSSPKGVHAQWIEDQFPKHLWPSIPINTHIWGEKLPLWLEREPDSLEVISGNIDMVKSKGAELLKSFIARHGPKTLILVDESDSIKNFKSSRSAALRKLAEPTRQRAIMTGTPIAKDLTDEWSQFYFLDPDIIGHKYLTSFRAQYCLMGGFEGRSVVGHKNLDHFKALTAPHIFRATKDDLDLPPKVYDELVFDLSDQQKKVIRSLRDSFFAELGNGTMTASNGATALLSIQQASNGYLRLSDGSFGELPNPRLDLLKKITEEISRPAIIWCRFKMDVLKVSQALPDAVTYYGSDNSSQRSESKAAFIDGKARYLVATAGAAGKGVDGLQKVCDTAIYYSNSFNAIDRWQSEDRIHRIGMGGTATFIDLVARGSVDRSILRNHRSKHAISESALDLKSIQSMMEKEIGT